MSVALKLAFLFFVGSCLGWVIELLFRRFISTANPERKWINPGFLVGPYLPLYGFALCAMYLLAGLENILPWDTEWIKKVALFVLMALCMTAIEYIAGIIFIKGMKVKLWDYSDEPGNIQGIICPRFSAIWAALGAIYYFLIHPFALTWLDWLEDNLTFTFVIGFFFGVFVIDAVYSFNILAKIRKFAVESEIVVKYQSLARQIRVSREKRKEKARFFLSMATEAPFSEHLKEYYDNMRRKVGESRENLTEKIKSRSKKDRDKKDEE